MWYIKASSAKPNVPILRNLYSIDNIKTHKYLKQQNYSHLRLPTYLFILRYRVHTDWKLWVTEALTVMKKFHYVEQHSMLQMEESHSSTVHCDIDLSHLSVSILKQFSLFLTEFGIFRIFIFKTRKLYWNIHGQNIVSGSDYWFMHSLLTHFY
jgi:hypothetical protein